MFLGHWIVGESSVGEGLSIIDWMFCEEIYPKYKDKHAQTAAAMAGKRSRTGKRCTGLTLVKTHPIPTSRPVARLMSKEPDDA
jgi:hypothetical protein